MFHEYDATSANARPCYSNMQSYGCNGKSRAIIPPTPVTVQPMMFNMLKPHQMSSTDARKIPDTPARCLPYSNINTYGNCY